MLELLKRVRESRPLFIWAPTARCGVTLLQRLITSTRDILVFGENAFLTAYLPVTVSGTEKAIETMEDARKRLVAGDYSFWSSAAYPKVEPYLASVQRCFLEICDTYQKSSEESGFSRWGVKEPQPTWEAFETLSILLPNSQNIFLYRDIRDVVKSYKAREWVKDSNDAARIAHQWASNLGVMMTLPESNRVLRIKYEDFLGDKDRGIKALTSFLGCSDPDRSVLDKKVNTFANDGPGHSKNEYVAPKELSDEELAVIDHIADSRMQELGYL